MPKTNSCGFTVKRLLNLIDPKHGLKKIDKKLWPTLQRGKAQSLPWHSIKHLKLVWFEANLSLSNFKQAEL